MDNDKLLVQISVSYDSFISITNSPVRDFGSPQFKTGTVKDRRTSLTLSFSVYRPSLISPFLLRRFRSRYFVPVIITDGRSHQLSTSLSISMNRVWDRVLSVRPPECRFDQGWEVSSAWSVWQCRQTVKCFNHRKRTTVVNKGSLIFLHSLQWGSKGPSSRSDHYLRCRIHPGRVGWPWVSLTSGPHYNGDRE